MSPARVALRSRINASNTRNKLRSKAAKFMGNSWMPIQARDGPHTIIGFHAAVPTP
jgi:hypothetical protein